MDEPTKKPTTFFSYFGAVQEHRRTVGLTYALDVLPRMFNLFSMLAVRIQFLMHCDIPQDLDPKETDRPNSRAVIWGEATRGVEEFVSDCGLDLLDNERLYTAKVYDVRRGSQNVLTYPATNVDNIYKILVNSEFADGQVLTLGERYFFPRYLFMTECHVLGCENHAVGGGSNGTAPMLFCAAHFDRECYHTRCQICRGCVLGARVVCQQCLQASCRIMIHEDRHLTLDMNPPFQQGYVTFCTTCKDRTVVDPKQKTDPIHCPDCSPYKPDFYLCKYCLKSCTHEDGCDGCRKKEVRCLTCSTLYVGTCTTCVPCAVCFEVGPNDSECEKCTTAWCSKCYRKNYEATGFMKCPGCGEGCYAEDCLTEEQRREYVKKWTRRASILCPKCHEVHMFAERPGEYEDKNFLVYDGTMEELFRAKTRPEDVLPWELWSRYAVYYHTRKNTFTKCCNAKVCIKCMGKVLNFSTHHCRDITSIRQCPFCNIAYVKTEGCSTIKCTNCGETFSHVRENIIESFKEVSDDEDVDDWNSDDSAEDGW